MLNCLLFAAYRLCFFSWFVQTPVAGDIARVLIYGLRLDLALLGFELCGIGIFALLIRRLRLSLVAQALSALTALHALVCVANFFAFAERSQNAGDLLLPYITSPFQVWLAVLPFIQQHWLLILGITLASGIYFWLGARISRWLEAGAASLDLWRDRKTFSLAVTFALMPMLLTVQPLIKRKDLVTGKGGVAAVFANSKFYTQFADFRENEAVINPLFEFVGAQIPNAMHQKVRYRLSEREALEEWTEDHGPEASERYPLLETIQGRKNSVLENVVVIQVEGLSGSVLEQERDGKIVTPFLRQMAKRGAYFPNTIQNANFTSGGVFSTASSVPKATWEQSTQRFASHELRGYYGSLAHVLGATNYTHYFCEGFRQSGDDFLAFMAYQGCKVLNYQSFRARLDAKHELADADSILGIHDGYMMQECAEILAQCPTRFTAHLMTCTTHSPWNAPRSFGKRFNDPALNTFAYLDESIEKFVKRIEASPSVAQKTLIVVLGDHTSVTFGKNLMERLRIPLIFYAPGLPKVENSGQVWASQVDVLPTVLGLLRGNHLYGGMGRDLFDRTEHFDGVVSGTRDTGYFLTDNWLLRYRPFGGESELFAVRNGMADSVDAAVANPGVLQHLTRECFARVELARRLSLDRRVYPLNSETLHLKIAQRSP